MLAMTRDNQPITGRLGLFYEGDMQALLGTGARFAMVIAGQDYLEESGLPDLATPIADAEALVVALALWISGHCVWPRGRGEPVPAQRLAVGD